MSRKVIHIENKETHVHDYFGSIAALIASSKKTGFSKGKLYSLKSSLQLENEKYIIRRGTLKSKSSFIKPNKKKINSKNQKTKKP